MGTIRTGTRPQSEPMVTIEELDEALWWTSRQLKRDNHWHRWMDALLDQRNEITGETPDENLEIT